MLVITVQSGTSHSDESMGSSSSEKTKVLLERMKMLETEKTCLVLENERQCEQYEQCLDDITSQVLQAVMAQRVTDKQSSIISHDTSVISSFMLALYLEI